MSAANVCQYWNEDEPTRCSNWSGTVCVEPAASRYPGCNNIGTDSQCSHYSGEGEVFSTCILPDQYRHVVNRKTGAKWTIPEINEYNDGGCDGSGTAVTCSGFSPYHLGFSSFTPDGTGDADSSGYSVIGSEELPYRLPHNYLVVNNRAKISKCHYWSGEAGSFVMDLDSGKVVAPEFKCDSTDDEVNQFALTTYDDTTGTINTSCNGAKPECGRYTGVCWRYCVDDLMKQGDKLRAEQLLELRYYWRQEAWTRSSFELSFDDKSIIYAWEGSVEEATDYEDLYPGEEYIPSTSGYIVNVLVNMMESFDYFNLHQFYDVTSEGTPVGWNGSDSSYPTLVRYLNDPPLKPIIRNRFAQDDPTAEEQVTGVDSGDVGVFEVTSTTDEDVIIWGDSFSEGLAYAVDLLDPVIRELMPLEIYNYDSVFEINTVLNSTDGNDEQSEDFLNFYLTLNNVLQYLILKRPDKIFSGVAGRGGFYIPTPTKFGGNSIAVFSSTYKGWEYDKVLFIKQLVGGYLSQDNFEVTSDGGTVTYSPGYETSFMGAVNRGSTTIDVSLNSISTASGPVKIAYAFNDSVLEPIPKDPANPVFKFELGYKLFQISITEFDDVTFFGRSGYCMVTINHPNFNTVHGAPVFENLILNSNGKQIPMEVLETGTSRVETNQVFLKPVDIEGPAGFKRPCSAGKVLPISGQIWVYKKSSDYNGFGDDDAGTPDSRLAKESWLPEDDALIEYKDTCILTVSDSGVIVSDFGYYTIVLSVVYKGAKSGLVKGMVKTKLITWVKQPYCRDVEIKYQWSSPYQEFRLTPTHTCEPNEIGQEYIGDSNHAFFPWCGDHSLNRNTGKGPMWYPYHVCESYDLYRNLGPGAGTHQTNSVMEVFEETEVVDIDPLTGNKIEEKVHGAWDMRMLGPSINYGYRGVGFASIWACRCDFRYYNHLRAGGNFFSGYGNIRCGISDYELVKMVEWGGVGPLFGNPFRDFIRSYRSFDSEYYYYMDINSGSYIRLKKWMPAPYQFGISDITSLKESKSYPFKLYCSEDYSNVVPQFGDTFEESGSFATKDISTFVSQFSSMLAGEVDGVQIKEKFSNKEVRFDDVLNCHTNIGWINYPKPREQQYAGQNMVPVKAWYTYKYISDQEAIQYVWRSPWKPIKRQEYYSSDAPAPVTDGVISCHVENSGDASGAIAPYTGSGDDVTGQFLFLDVTYPEYQYSYNLRENKLVCDAGVHDIEFSLPSELQEEGEGIDFYFLRIDGGTWRAISFNGSFDPVISEDIENPDENTNHIIYKEWFNEYPTINGPSLWVGNFETVSEAAQDAVDNGRVAEAYDEYGEKIDIPYQEGINIVVKGIHGFPAVHEQLSESEAVFTGGGVARGGDVTEEGVPYPADVTQTMVYDINTIKDVEISYTINNSQEEGDNNVSSGAISRVDITFDEVAQTGDEGGVEFHSHTPSVIIVVNGVTVTSCDVMELYKTGSYEYTWPISPTVLTDGVSDYEDYTVELYMRCKPTEIELTQAGVTEEEFYRSNNFINIENVIFYRSRVVSAKEEITTTEHLYTYSTGATGSAGFPVTEKGGNGVSLVVPLFYEGSTSYQQDDKNGVYRAPGTGFRDLADGWKTSFVTCGDKHRSRTFGAVFDDKAGLVGSDVGEWETYQAEIYNAVVSASTDNFVMSLVAPPFLEDIFDNISSASMSFGGGTASFTNTLIRDLATVSQHGNYNPEGYRWEQKVVPVWNSALNVIGSLRCPDLIYRDVLVEYWYKKPSETGGNFQGLFEAYVNATFGYFFSQFADPGGHLERAASGQIGTSSTKFWDSVNTKSTPPPQVSYGF